MAVPRLKEKYEAIFLTPAEWNAIEVFLKGGVVKKTVSYFRNTNNELLSRAEIESWGYFHEDLVRSVNTMMKEKNFPYRVVLAEDRVHFMFARLKKE